MTCVTGAKTGDMAISFLLVSVLAGTKTSYNAIYGGISRGYIKKCILAGEHP
jgi:hypothetical protein